MRNRFEILNYMQYTSVLFGRRRAGEGFGESCTAQRIEL